MWGVNFSLMAMFIAVFPVGSACQAGIRKGSQIILTLNSGLKWTGNWIKSIRKTLNTAAGY